MTTRSKAWNVKLNPKYNHFTVNITKLNTVKLALNFPRRIKFMEEENRHNA